MLDPTQLRYFKTIAEHGSVTAAARALHVSQPALSQSIKALERALGAQLFERSRQGVTLTRAGERLLEHATRLLEALSACERDIHAIENDPIGEYVVGCHKSLGSYFLPGLLRLLRERAPDLQLTIASGSSQSVRDRVLAHEVHVGVVVDVEPHPSLVIVELFEDSMDVCATAPARTLAEATELLERGPLVYAEGVVSSEQLLSRLAETGHASVRRLPCGDLELVRSLVAAGVGVGIVPRRVAAEAGARVRRLHPELPSLGMRVSAIYRSDMHRTQAALRLKDTVVAHGASLPALDV